MIVEPDADLDLAVSTTQDAISFSVMDPPHLANGAKAPHYEAVLKDFTASKFPTPDPATWQLRQKVSDDQHLVDPTVL